MHIYTIYVHIEYLYKVFKVNPHLKNYGRCVLQSLYKCYKFTY